MNINLNVVIKVQPECSTGVTSKLDRILTLLGEIKMTQAETNAAMDKLEAEAAAEGDAVVAIENSLDGIAGQLAAALADNNGADPALVARMVALEAALRDRKASIAAKILADVK